MDEREYIKVLEVLLDDLKDVISVPLVGGALKVVILIEEGNITLRIPIDLIDVEDGSTDIIFDGASLIAHEEEDSEDEILINLLIGVLVEHLLEEVKVL
jgi:hypothetical protein